MSSEKSGANQPTRSSMSRYPLYAAVYNNSLVYTSGVFGQTTFPWRALVSPTATSSPGAPLASPSRMVAPLAQLPGLVYPLPTLGPMPVMATQGGGSPQGAPPMEGSTAAHQGHELVKRRNESVSVPDFEPKRPRLSESTPHSPLTPDSHTSLPSSRVPVPPSSSSSQRSPVIKFIPYKPGQTVLLPQAVSSSSPSSLAQAILLPVSTTPLHAQPQERKSPPIQHGQSSPMTSYKVVMSTALPPALPPDLRLVLLKCFGPVPESVISGNRLLVSNILQDLYRPSYFTTSNYSDPPLSPESCALLTISYLNALQSGEGICVERLRTMMHYAQLGEFEWLHYYKKHKKMSESTFVQSQLMHLSRVSVYPGLGKVRVMISNQNLGDGITLALHNLAQLIDVSRASLPEFVVVLAIRPSATIDFCILVVDPLQVRLLMEVQSLSSVQVGRKRASKWRASDNDRRQQSRWLDKHSAQKVSITIDRDLLASVGAVQRKLCGRVLVPFHCTGHGSASGPGSVPDFSLLSRSPLVPPSVAECLVPSAPFVVEHFPQGPYQLQYNMAVYLLQRLISAWKSQDKVEGYKAVDFRVLCPPEESFVQQTIGQIVESRIIEYLDLGSGEAEEEEVNRRVIRCGSFDQLNCFLDELDEKTLYVVVAEAGHLTTSITCHGQQDKASLSDSEQLLCRHGNVFMLYVSSQPYALQTNRSLVPYANEIHWPIYSPCGGKGEEPAMFCSSSECQSREWDHRVSFREDNVFETSFQYACERASSMFLPSLVALRTQLLLNEYTAALSSFSFTCPPTIQPSPETQQVVNGLLGEALTNPQGYGPMVIIRSHDVLLGKQFFHKLRAVRDSLGLKYSFEVLFDDGKQPITVAEHFEKRLAQWSCCGKGSGALRSYRDLEHLPCVVVLVGGVRAGLSFPRSLRYVDLRMCHDSHTTRTVYENDISFFNGYRSNLLRHADPQNGQATAAGMGTTESMEVGENDSGSEVFEESRVEMARSHGLPRTVRADSSLSSRKSSCNMDLQEPSEEASQNRTIVEWRPHSSPASECSSRVDIETREDKSETEWQEGEEEEEEEVEGEKGLEGKEVEEGLEGEEEEEGEGEKGQEVEEGEEEEEEEEEGVNQGRMNDESVHEINGPVTVTIDPPEDQVGTTVPYLPESVVPSEEECKNRTVQQSSPEFECSSRGDLETKADVSETVGQEGEVVEEEEDNQGRVNDESFHENGINGPVTVSVDPPEDQASTAVPHLPEFHSGDPKVPFQSPRSTEMEDEEEDLWAGLEEERDEDEVGSPTRVCLLSRPYFHIWSSRSPQQLLLLPPCPGVDWHGGHKRPPLFDPDPHQQSAHYRKWSKPRVREVKAELDTLAKEASQSPWRRFLLTGPPQVGKTGAWLLFIHLLHEHLRSAHGAVVMNYPQPPSLFMGNAALKTCSQGQKGLGLEVNGRRGRIISPKQLREICRSLGANGETKSDTLSRSPSPKTLGEPSGSRVSVPQTLLLSASSQLAYDCTHSCTDCSKYLRGSLSPPALLTSSLPMEKGATVTIQWYIPSQFQRFFVISHDRKKLEHLNLPMVINGQPFPHPLSPIFVPSLGRDCSGLFNLFHTSQLTPEQVHVVVTSASQFNKYRKSWPNHIVMALPDEGSLGLGLVYHTLKQFVQYNYQLNRRMEYGRQTVWPFVLFMSDSCAMWKVAGEGERSSDISLSEVLRSLEGDPHSLELAAISLPQWNQGWEESGGLVSLSDYDLNHDFILLNLSKIATVQYKSFSYNSGAVDFNLQLQAAGLGTRLRTDMAVARKYLSSGGNTYPVRMQLSGICSDADHLVTSLHHDSSSLLPYPGPYLMEHLLLHKSQTFFPSSKHPEHPVLVVDNYVELGLGTNITFVKSDSLCGEENSDDQMGVKFGGLLLYLCEGKVGGEELRKMDFVLGACLCMVTRDCKSLVREVARLDLEERWKFRLRDEYQTACPDSFRPLFFLMGRYEGY